MVKVSGGCRRPQGEEIKMMGLERSRYARVWDSFGGSCFLSLSSFSYSCFRVQVIASTNVSDLLV